MTRSETAMADYYRHHGIKVNSDLTVTVYHATPSKDDILREGRLKAGDTANTENEPAVWLAPSLEAVEPWTSHGSRDILKLRVPVEALKHLPQYFQQLYVIGDLQRDGDVWRPVRPVPKTWHNYIASRKEFYVTKIQRKKRKNGLAELGGTR